MQLIALVISAILIKGVFLFEHNINPQDVNENLSDDGGVLMACGTLTFQLRNHILLETNAKLCKIKLDNWLQRINQKMLDINVIAANLTWTISMGLGDLDETFTDNFENDRLKWRKDVCDKLSNVDVTLIREDQRRQMYLLCRGAFYSAKESEISSRALSVMQNIYTTSKICVPHSEGAAPPSWNVSAVEHAVITYMNAVNDLYSANSDDDFLDEGDEGPNEPEIRDDVVDMASLISSQLVEGEENNVCFSGEPGLERLAALSRNEYFLRWMWLAWREKVGPPMKLLYPVMVAAENAAAKRSGYADIGEVWRDELEIPNLEMLADELYNDIRDLYVALHGVARFFLRRFYGPSVVSEKGPIPAHILGNLWGQNWESIIDLILPQALHVDLDKLIKSTNWTSFDMIKRAEDFYTSMGLPPMTDKFWKLSYFGVKSNASSGSENSKCHGTAANMFVPDDFRMIYCAGLSMEDFYVIHHEMGHIEYYMAYDKNLPALFKNGANSAIQESVGDAVMYGVLTPQHLQRLGLINDRLMYRHVDFPDEENKIINSNPQDQDEIIKNFKTNLFTKNDLFDSQVKDTGLDTLLVLRQALSKIPQIPFEYIIDKYRWDIFSGKIQPKQYNKAFWDYIREFQGLEPPNHEERPEKYFDAGAKFHIPDNTPYVRYFLSSFLSIQMYRAMCQWSLFHKASPELVLPMPLHRCDIYGSKIAGRKLREMMSKGSSMHWSKTLHLLTGDNKITSAAFNEYFRPLKRTLLKLIHQHNIPLGW